MKLQESEYEIITLPIYSLFFLYREWTLQLAIDSVSIMLHFHYQVSVCTVVVFTSIICNAGFLIESLKHAADTFFIPYGVIFAGTIGSINFAKNLGQS